MKNKMNIGTAACAAILALNASTGFGQVFDSVEALKNTAVAASPRAKEVFPWLTRGALNETATKAGVVAVTGQRMAAASPRAIEANPALARPAQPPKAEAAGSSAILRNRALAASPRAQEDFPWLARGDYSATEEPFQIAPLK